jgi:uncharacterized protein (TIGR00661 family)
MKILYAIQGTGNGHIAVAREVLPMLQRKGDVDVLISGTQVDVALNADIRYQLHGMSFIFGKGGGIDYLETYKKSNIRALFNEIQTLPVEDYDLVISDFEPVSAWACYLKNKPCIGFSHQGAVVNKKSPKPAKKDIIGKAVLKYYAPVSYSYGFHYLAYDRNIFTPVIRKEIRQQAVINDGHYTVYLPSYSDEKIIKLLSGFPQTTWEVFSKHSTEAYEEDDNIYVRPINNEQFIKSIASAAGVLCNAGFQVPAETLFLKKKLIVLPMKGQYEQHCNAAALKMIGVPVLKNIKQKQYDKIKAWMESDERVTLPFPDQTDAILDKIISKHYNKKPDAPLTPKTISSFSKFRNLVLKKNFLQLGAYL